MENDSLNTNICFDVEKQKSEENIKEQKNSNNIIKFLLYAAATLSFVSFLTTASGMNYVIGDEEHWKAFLISFGIQAIVLILGTRFFYVWEIIKGLAKSYKRFIQLAIICLYICSVFFSSFFSYVFLANHSYDKVKNVDYNIAIEKFLVSETKNLKEYNDIAGRILLSEVQNQMPSLNSLINEFDQLITNKIESTKDAHKLKKNENKNIPQNLIFNSSMTKNEVNATESEIQLIDTLCAQINSYADQYPIFYEKYNSLFDELSNFSDYDLVLSRISLINSTIDTMEEALTDLDKITLDRSYYTTINNLIGASKSAIKNYYEILIYSFQELKNVYSEINDNHLSRKNVEKEINLSDVYKIIYSPDSHKPEEFESAIETIRNILLNYLDSTAISETETLDDNKIQNITVCITYLEEFVKYKNLDAALSSFEQNNLSNVYILSDSDVESTTVLEKENKKVIEKTEKRSTNEDNTKINPKVVSVSAANWQEIRREDLATYIRLLKTMPNVKLIVQSIINSKSGTDISDLSGLTNYVNNTLEKAYKLDRDTLESINEVETAWNFFGSEFNKMAIFSLLVALFLDIASFIIGVFIFFNKSNNIDAK